MIEPILEKAKEFLRDSRNRKNCISCLLVAAAVIYFFAVAIPCFGKFVSVSRSLGLKRRDIRTARENIRRIDEYAKKAEFLKRELEKYSKNLPAEKEIAALLDGFSSMALESGTKILSITPQKLRSFSSGVEESKFFAEMPITITAKSGFHELGGFVNRMERSKRLIMIGGVEIKYDKAAPRMHDVMIKVKTYVSMDEKK